MFIYLLILLCVNGNNAVQLQVFYSIFNIHSFILWMAPLLARICQDTSPCVIRNRWQNYICPADKRHYLITYSSTLLSVKAQYICSLQTKRVNDCSRKGITTKTSILWESIMCTLFNSWQRDFEKPSSNTIRSCSFHFCTISLWSIFSPPSYELNIWGDWAFLSWFSNQFRRTTLDSKPDAHRSSHFLSEPRLERCNPRVPSVFHRKKGVIIIYALILRTLCIQFIVASSNFIF